MPNAQPDDFMLAVQHRPIRSSCCWKAWRYWIPRVKPTNQVILRVAKERRSESSIYFHVFSFNWGTKINRILKYHWLRSPISLRGCWHLCWVLRPVTARLALPSAYYTWFGSTQKKTTGFKWDWIRYCMTTLNAPNHQKVFCCSQTWVGLDGPFSWSLKWWYQIYQFETRGLWLSFAAQQDQRMRRWANGVSFSDFFGNCFWIAKGLKEMNMLNNAHIMPTEDLASFFRPEIMTTQGSSKTSLYTTE